MDVKSLQIIAYLEEQIFQENPPSHNPTEKQVSENQWELQNIPFPFLLIHFPLMFQITSKIPAFQS